MRTQRPGRLWVQGLTTGNGWCIVILSHLLHSMIHTLIHLNLTRTPHKVVCYDSHLHMWNSDPDTGDLPRVTQWEVVGAGFGPRSPSASLDFLEFFHLETPGAVCPWVTQPFRGWGWNGGGVCGEVGVVVSPAGRGPSGQVTASPPPLAHKQSRGFLPAALQWCIFHTCTPVLGLGRPNAICLLVSQYKQPVKLRTTWHQTHFQGSFKIYWLCFEICQESDHSHSLLPP